MTWELDPDLRQRSEAILETKSDRIGRAYWDSRLKRSLDLVASGMSLPFASFPVVLGGVSYLS
ncbi:hypothetical protein A2W15_02680 [Candidatus Woesebacteria bacterium RBG_16_41_13]|nr:MAG: hypothetical protein A2W15_02680 [Candidatus Woesebacteria bacterium RBG_16_41_13]